MDQENNKFEKYSDEELRLMLAIAMQDDAVKAQDILNQNLLRTYFPPG